MVSRVVPLADSLMITAFPSSFRAKNKKKAIIAGHLKNKETVNANEQRCPPQCKQTHQCCHDVADIRSKKLLKFLHVKLRNCNFYYQAIVVGMSIYSILQYVVPYLVTLY